MDSSKGFTLIEMMVAIAIIAILASVGIPAFQNMTLNNRITTTTNGLLGVLQLARSEAVTKRRDITVCPSTDQATCTAGTAWREGVVVLEGANILRALPATSGSVEIISAITQLTYQTTGRLSSADPQFSIQDDRGVGSTSREICINLVGQVTSARGDVGC
ncbi:GspH/FimT family pseudopilin [Pseudomonas sp. TMP25]|uniref:GspH/FimT family pseudopilin n=1 Tax=Pseudomonas sp. TMP25 TaxID=3136561 RepID=UPI0031011F6A